MESEAQKGPQHAAWISQGLHPVITVVESEQVFLSSDKVCPCSEELQTAKITVDTHLLVPLRSTVIEHL